uniref:Putative juvenile hormone acid methyl transferase n=1 Tax=Nyssomyia neivai TaxID=330878 RepID=A0A1L8DN67_9DIPT
MGTKFHIDFTKVLVNDFFGWINWRKNGMDTILDIGSGPGHTVHEAILPKLPQNFSKLVLSDISPEMVALQKEEFAGNPKISCEILDIGSDISEDLLCRLGTFDHITSIACLMWVPDQQKAMDNIYKLLKPGGDCFLSIVAKSPAMDAITSVCEKPRWKDFFIGWKDFYVFPYNIDIEEAKLKALNYMKKAGFVETKADLRHNPFLFESDQEKENFLRSRPNKFSKDVSTKEEEEIFQDRLEVFDKFNLGNYRDNSNKIEKLNSHVILYGKKPV